MSAQIGSQQPASIHVKLKQKSTVGLNAGKQAVSSLMMEQGPT